MLDPHDENTILGYVEGELDERGRAAFEALMAQDESLRLLVSELVRDREMLRAVPAEEAPAHLMARVTEALEREMLVAAPVAAAHAPRVLRFPMWARWAGAMAAMLLLTAGVLWQVDPFGWSKPGDIDVVIAPPPVIPNPPVPPVIVDPTPTPPAPPIVTGPANLAGDTNPAGGKGTIALAMAEEVHFRRSLDRKSLDGRPKYGADADFDAAGGPGGGRGQPAASAAIDPVALQIELQSASPVAMRELLVAWADSNDATDSPLTKRMEARRMAFGESGERVVRKNRDQFEQAIETERADLKTEGDNEGPLVQAPPTRGAPGIKPGAASPAKPDIEPNAHPEAKKEQPPGVADRADQAPGATRGSKSPSPAPPKSPAPDRVEKSSAQDKADPQPPAPPRPEPKATANANDAGNRADPAPAADAKGAAVAKADAATLEKSTGEGGDADPRRRGRTTDDATGAAANDDSLAPTADAFKAAGHEARQQAREEVSLLVPADKLDSLVQHIEKRTGQSLVVVRDAEGAYLLSPQIANQRALALAAKAAESEAAGKDRGPAGRAVTSADESKESKKELTDDIAPAAPADPARPSAPLPPGAAPPAPAPADVDSAKKNDVPAPTVPAPTPAAPAVVEPAAPTTPKVLPAPSKVEPPEGTRTDAAAPAAPAAPAKQKVEPRRVLVRIVIVEGEKK